MSNSYGLKTVEELAKTGDYIIVEDPEVDYSQYLKIKLKIFSSKEYLLPNSPHVVILYPFWGKNMENPDDPRSGRFDKYAEIGKHFFEMTRFEESDIAVFPIPWEFAREDARAREIAREFSTRAEEGGKRVVVFFLTDSDEKIHIDNTIVFRTSLYGSKRTSEYAMPGWNEDLVTMYMNSKLHLRVKKDKPVVGFCGYSWTPKPTTLREMSRILEQAKELLSEKPKKSDLSGCKIRGEVLRILARTGKIRTNFIIHYQSWGGAKKDGAFIRSKVPKVRQEFLDNMISSDYVVCTRGAGNFSYRFYETLCCGRIPVFVNTDCVLPYDFDIDWRKYVVWIEADEVDGIGERIREFHQSLSPEEFLELQVKCRGLWKTHLSPQGFFVNFYKHFLH